MPQEPALTRWILQLDSKKVALEQQYINLLEQRVAQLQKLVTTSSESKKDVSFVPQTHHLIRVFRALLLDFAVTPYVLLTWEDG